MGRGWERAAVRKEGGEGVQRKDEVKKARDEGGKGEGGVTGDGTHTARTPDYEFTPTISTRLQIT